MHGRFLVLLTIPAGPELPPAGRRSSESVGGVPPCRFLRRVANLRFEWCLFSGSWTASWVSGCPSESCRHYHVDVRGETGAPFPGVRSGTESVNSKEESKSGDRRHNTGLPTSIGKNMRKVGNPLGCRISDFYKGQHRLGKPGTFGPAGMVNTALCRRDLNTSA